MANTPNYALEKYEAGNSANLLEQYNSSLNKIAEAIKSVGDKAEFLHALGLTASNAKILSTTH